VELMPKLRVILQMPSFPEEHQPLKRADLRQYDDTDLLLEIAWTDAVMFRRELTDVEKHNFWLVIDERRSRQQ
jgi:hypothetical protein